jgi:hypothetical protein
MSDSVVSLSVAGDNIFVYCYNKDGTTYNFLAGFSYKGPWLEDGLDRSTYSTGHSALPDSLLTTGSIALPHLDNYHYAGPFSGTKSQLLGYLTDPINWSGSNDPSTTTVYTVPTFIIEEGGVGGRRREMEQNHNKQQQKQHFRKSRK